MEKIRFGVIGAGWRSEFFVRIGKALPEIFEITGVMVRNPEKAIAYKEKMDVNVVGTIDELIATGMDYVISSVPKTSVLEILKEFYAKGVPVLCETPPSDIDEELDKVWNLTQEMNGKIQILEQYLFQPLYGSWLKVIEDGKLGEVQNVNISSLHDYHGLNIIRHFLGTGFEPCTIYGSKHTFNITKTKTRAGDWFDGEVVPLTRVRGTIEFESGKVGFYDFTEAQYHTYIRTRQLNVQGVRGEIDDLEIRYLTDENLPVKTSLNRVDMGIYNNSYWSHKGIMLNEEYIFRSPFPTARLNDDEIAIATCMLKMRDYINDGTEFYPLKEALQDTYISNLVKEAAQTPGRIIKTEKRVWMD